MVLQLAALPMDGMTSSAVDEHTCFSGGNPGQSLTITGERWSCLLAQNNPPQATVSVGSCTLGGICAAYTGMAVRMVVLCKRSMDAG